MGKCLNCGEVVATQTLKSGLCPACYTPERVKELAKKERKRVELTKNGKSIKLGLGFDWLLFITGVLLGIVAPLLPLIHGDWRGTLKLFGVYSIFLAALIFTEKNQIDVLILNIIFWISWSIMFPKMHIKHLLKSGWKPANEMEEEKLRKLGIVPA